MISFDRVLLLLLVRRRRLARRVRSGFQGMLRTALERLVHGLSRQSRRVRYWRLVWRAALFRTGRALDSALRSVVRKLLWGVAWASLAAALWLAYSSSFVQGYIDRGGQAIQDERRRLHWAMGWPLPGAPDVNRLDLRLTEQGLARGAPVFIRIFKREHELELWMKRGDRFVLFTTYPICRFSGRLGPKLRAGDRQAPEGFYTVGRGQLNPHSRWSRAFNVGFPNIYDQSHGRTGSAIMVHGGCSSIGCYAMTNPVIEEIWELVVAAMDRGQKRFSVHVFPFRMTEEKLAQSQGEPWLEFWRDLKKGYDVFEQFHTPPQINVCQGRYAVAPGAVSSDGTEDLKTTCREALHEETPVPSHGNRGG